MYKNIIKRWYHPGYSKNMKLVVPKCPENIKSQYYKPVWGNGIQRKQLYENHSSHYQTNDINYYSEKIQKNLKEEILFLPTSHNTPIETSLYSCRNLIKNVCQYIKSIEKLNVMKEDGTFHNTTENRKRILSVLEECKSKQEKDILESALYGIFSNFGDSVYIANDYLQLDNHYCIVSNYPNKASQREIEKSRVIATNLHYGNMPIILDSNVNFEGEANIKLIPAMIEKNSKKYQLCISYESSRSESFRSIKNINHYLEKLNLPLLIDITFKPKKGTEQLYYHLDCILNFYANEIQYFASEMDFWQYYKKNGLCVVVKDGLDNIYIQLLDRLFEKVITLDPKDDPLIANMIVKQNGLIGTSNVNKYTRKEIERHFPHFLDYIHPSSGGGGAHKCCSNVLSVGKKRNVKDWIEFSKEINIELSPQLIHSVQNEYNRLFLSNKN